MNDEVIEMQPRESAVAIQSTTPSDLLRLAVQQGADLEKLEKLMELQERWEANQARKAYVEAMSEFKKNPPEIFKDKTVSFKTDKGQTTYDHATIGNVVEKIVGALAKHGFSHRWIPNRSEGGMISITCVITHKLGHSEETTLEAGLDQSGGKNNIQAMISTKTYLERHSLLAATGLATKDQEDDDGHGSSASPSDACALMIQEALATKTDAEALAYWRENNGKIAKDKKNHARLKQVVLDHRAKLQSAATKPTGPQDRDIASLTADMDAAADEGLDAFTRAWGGLSKESQDKLADEFDRFKAKATKKGAKK